MDTLSSSEFPSPAGDGRTGTGGIMGCGDFRVGFALEGYAMLLCFCHEANRFTITDFVVLARVY